MKLLAILILSALILTALVMLAQGFGFSNPLDGIAACDAAKNIFGCGG